MAGIYSPLYNILFEGELFMYVLNRIPQVITKRVSVGPGEVNETIYEYRFEFVEVVGDRFRYNLKVFTRPIHAMRSVSEIPNVEYDIIVRSMEELNTLYRYPEYACEYIAKEARGLKFKYIELQVPDNDDEDFELGTLNSDFNAYVEIRPKFSSLKNQGITLTGMVKRSPRFAFKNEKPIYKGYCFTDEIDTIGMHKDTIMKLIKQFSNNEKDDE